MLSECHVYSGEIPICIHLDGLRFKSHIGLYFVKRVIAVFQVMQNVMRASICIKYSVIFPDTFVLQEPTFISHDFEEDVRGIIRDTYESTRSE